MRDKGANEKFVFEQFKDLYIGMPDGTYQYADPPWTDVVWTMSSKRIIGIEITEAVISENELARDAFKNELTDLVLTNLEPTLPFPFDLAIKPNKEIPIKQAQKQEIVQELVKICSLEAARLKNFETMQLEDFGADIKNYPLHIQKMIHLEGYRNLPRGIKSIRLGRWDFVGKSWNSQKGGGVVPDFTQEQLHSILQVKENKLKKYQKCDEYWLIIWESGGLHSYYDKINIFQTPFTKFDKVFLARTYRDMIVVFK